MKKHPPSFFKLAGFPSGRDIVKRGRSASSTQRASEPHHVHSRQRDQGCSQLTCWTSPFFYTLLITMEMSCVMCWCGYDSTIPGEDAWSALQHLIDGTGTIKSAWYKNAVWSHVSCRRAVQSCRTTPLAGMFWLHYYTFTPQLPVGSTPPLPSLPSLPAFSPCLCLSLHSKQISSDLLQARDKKKKHMQTSGQAQRPVTLRLLFRAEVTRRWQVEERVVVVVVVGETYLSS